MHGQARVMRYRGLLALIVGAILFFSTAPASAEDSVSGTMTVGGKSYKLSHVSARRQPSMTDKTKTVLVVLLTDNAVPKNVLDDRYRLELTDLARDGRLHGLSVTLGLDKKPAGSGFTYAKEFGGAIVNREDQHFFAPAVFTDARAEGKLSGNGSFGDQKWEYTATFKAAVSTLK